MQPTLFLSVGMSLFGLSADLTEPGAKPSAAVVRSADACSIESLPTGIAGAVARPSRDWLNPHRNLADGLPHARVRVRRLEQAMPRWSAMRTAPLSSPLANGGSSVLEDSSAPEHVGIERVPPASRHTP